MKMLRLLLVTVGILAASTKCDRAGDQLVLFKNMTNGPIPVMTTGTGTPIKWRDTSTLNKNLISNEFFIELTTHFDRERIPERVVHAKGAGAFGYFEVTHDVSDICNANFLSNVGKKTPVAVRFSSVLEEKGGIDTPREPRGFAIKFYTEEGNFDIVGLDFPVFALKDPIKFPSFIHALKKNPATGLKDSNMMWDFITLNPESLHFFLYVFGDRGIPDGYRYMPGFSIHTYQVISKSGENKFIRFHMIPDLGERNLWSEEARRIAGEDQDYYVRDLYNAIGNCDFPTWTIAVQVLSVSDVKNANIDVFDVNKILPLDKYPLRLIGRLVLDRNPVNFFAEVEQLAFNPSNLVPGILGAPDKLFEARRLSYRDTHNHRLGGNFFNIPVNCPFRTKTFTYNRDGFSPVKDNMKDIPNYYANSFHGPVPYKDGKQAGLVEIFEELPDSLEQARDRYFKEMSADERGRLVDNIVFSLRTAASFLQERAIQLFAYVSQDLSERIKHGLYTNITNSVRYLDN